MSHSPRDEMQTLFALARDESMPVEARERVGVAVAGAAVGGLFAFGWLTSVAKAASGLASSSSIAATVATVTVVASVGVGAAVLVPTSEAPSRPAVEVSSAPSADELRPRGIAPLILAADEDLPVAARAAPARNPAPLVTSARVRVAPAAPAPTRSLERRRSHREASSCLAPATPTPPSTLAPIATPPAPPALSATELRLVSRAISALHDHRIDDARRLVAEYDRSGYTMLRQEIAAVRSRLP